MEPFTCGNWWFIPLIFCAIMMIACLSFFARGGFGRQRRRAPHPCCWGGGSSVDKEAPLDLLKARYARGDINKNEFEEMKRDLN